MPTATNEIELPVPAERAFEAVADFGRYDEWLTVHQGWPQGPPSEASTGTTFKEQVKVMRTPVEVNWTVSEFDAPTALSFEGTGPMGSRMRSSYRVSAAGEGSRLTLESEMDGGPLAGPMGKMVINSAEKMLGESLEKLKALLLAEPAKETSAA